MSLAAPRKADTEKFLHVPTLFLHDFIEFYCLFRFSFMDWSKDVPLKTTKPAQPSQTDGKKLLATMQANKE